MLKEQSALSKNGRRMHYSVGAIIKKDGKYLLMDRAIEPFGFAGIAGHVDDNETEVEALKREVKEESGFDVEKYELVFEGELDFEPCSRGVEVHYWKLYACETSGNLQTKSKEIKSIDWYSTEEMKDLKFEKSWAYFFRKLRII